jgi:hypothetical protein
MKVQNLMESFSDSCCLACCYNVMAYYHMNKEFPSDKMIVDGLWKAYFSTKYLGDDATVNDAEQLLKYWTGDRAVVEKLYDMESINKLLNSNEMFIAMYSYHKGDDATKIGHFVIMQGRKIVFNSLDWSKNVATGVITTVRKITWK